MWAKFDFGSFSAPRGFPLGSPVFSSLQKPALPKFQFNRMQDFPENHFRVSGASEVDIINYTEDRKMISYFYSNTAPFWLKSII